MKKTALTILLATACIIASAQNGHDAWMFSESDYEGTARSVAMGNAFTALGGDLGAVTINPAGSAVAGYSQFTITPSLTFSTNTTSGVAPQGSNTLPYFEKTFRNTIAKAGVPNVGFSFNLDTGRKSGLKTMSFGFIANRTNSWCEDVYAKGTNSTTSFAAYMADHATSTLAEYNANRPASEPEFTYLDFEAEDAYKYMPWQDVVGYRSGIFARNDMNSNEFIGATELLLPNGNLQQGGPLNQTYGKSIYGSKYDYTFNVGANISDFIYIGINLNIVSLSYDMTEYFKEAAVDMDDFKNEFGADGTAYFNSMMYKYSYSASGTGVSGKFGVIVTPGFGLRLGAAVQTPTSGIITEQWQEKGEVNYDNSKFNGNASSPLGESKYRLISPLRANFGIAYTLGKFALISADYEVTDYGSMKFRAEYDEDREFFDLCNEDIKAFYSTAHNLRLGAEVKPLGALSIRAGYNFLLDTYKDSDPLRRNSISFGAGYSSKGSFFADIACRYTLEDKEYITPYQPYNDEYVPEILNRHSDWKLLLTIGWRF